MQIIYGLRLRDESLYRYIGKTRYTIEKRLSQHLKGSKASYEYPIQRWIRKHGKDSVVIEVIETCEDESANDRERFWIAKLRLEQGNHMSKEPNHLLNLTEGGDGGGVLGSNGKTKTPEQRKRISEGKKGAVFTEEHRAKLSAAKKGTTISDEHRANTRAGVIRANHRQGSHRVPKEGCTLCVHPVDEEI